MDVSLSPNSKSLTLISNFSPSSPQRFCSLQREFLGCGHRLRPPGLHRSHKKSKKLVNSHVQSPRFIFRASLFSQPAVVVVVAVATVSALTVIYFNYVKTHTKKQHSGPDVDHKDVVHLSKEVKVSLNQDTESQKLDHEDVVHLSKQIKVSVNPDAEHEKLDREDVVLSTHTIEKNVSVDNDSVHSHAYETQKLQVERISSMHGAVKTLDVSGSDLVVSNATGLVSTETLEEDSIGAEISSEQHQLVIQPTSNGSVVAGNIENGELKQDHKPSQAVSQATNLRIPGHYNLLKDTSREELHRFYEENHGTRRSISDHKDLNSMSTQHVSHSNRLSSLLRSSLLHRSEASLQTSDQSSASLNGHLPLARNKDVLSSKIEEYRRGVELSRDTEKGFAPGKIPRDQHESPEPNGWHGISTWDPIKYMKTYNRFLRDGRLADCIELLESMEQNGILDMNKIYHVKFFNMCKSQKAVKEAFRFVKLISNPTLSTFNMLLSVCANSQDSEGAFKVLRLVKDAGMIPDCKLYTTLISTCGKSGKVDSMFEVFHKMVNAGVEPNLHTYGALIDGSARAGQVAKAFGAYGILRSKNVKPDRVVFNALITACGQSGAVDRAFDVLAEMKAEPTPVDPDHVTVGALIKTCTQAGQFDRAREVYKMIHKYKIKGTPEVYTIAIRSSSMTGDLEFALGVYRDMTKNGVTPDEILLSTLIDVAGHAGNIKVAFEVLQEARTQGMTLGNITYSSLMGACSNSKNWQKALELYEDIKSIKLHPTVSLLNALLTALCDGDQLQKAVDIYYEMKKAGVTPNIITYSILIVGSEKKDDLDIGHMLYSQAKKEGVVPNLVICKCLIGMCLRRFQKAESLGEHVLSFTSGNPEIKNKWTTLALQIYRETLVSGIIPSMDLFSLVLACLQFPHDTSSRIRLVENLGVTTDSFRPSNLSSLLDGFGEYDPRCFSLLMEATSHGILPSVSFKDSPIVVDARNMQIHTVEVYLLTILKGLKHRLAAGAKLPNINVTLQVEKTQVVTPNGEKTIKLVGRVGQSVGALLRRIGLHYQGNESTGKIKINGLSIKRWFQPKLTSPTFDVKSQGLNAANMRLGKRIADQQRDIRMSNLSLN
ncbi:hypothetical protein ACHQM5_016931 [Ranunculus cassubicifolius]